MTGLTEAGALFPGSHKKVVIIKFLTGTIEILYEDGSSVTLKDPIQVQDMELAPGLGDKFMKALRRIEPTAARETFMERAVLEDVRDKLTIRYGWDD